MVLVKLARKSRRYFPAGSAVEVWREFSAPLATPLQSAAFEVCACALYPEVPESSSQVPSTWHKSWRPHVLARSSSAQEQGWRPA